MTSLGYFFIYKANRFHVSVRLFRKDHRWRQNVVLTTIWRHDKLRNSNLVPWLFLVCLLLSLGERPWLHVTTCDKLFHRGRINEAKERQSLVAILIHTLANRLFKFFNPILSFVQYNEIYLYVSSVMKYHCDFNLLRSNTVSLFRFSWINFAAIVRCVKRCFIYHFIFIFLPFCKI